MADGWELQLRGISTVSAEWFVGVDAQEFGPFTWEQMRQMAAEGRLIPTSQVRRQSEAQWTTAGETPGLLTPVAPTTPSSGKPPAAVKTAKTNVADNSKLKRARPISVPAANSQTSARHSNGSIPVGVPVGASVAPPTVAPPVVAASSAKFPVKLSTSSPKQAAPPKKAKSLQAEAADTVLKKRQASPWMLVTLLGGGALAVGVIGALVIYLSWRQPDHADQTSAASKTTTASAPAKTTAEGEANPGEKEVNPASDVASDRSEKKTPDTKLNAAKTEKKTGAAGGSLAAVKAVQNWSEGASFKIRIGAATKLVIERRAWLAGDAAGKPLAEGAAGSAQKYLFVEVHLVNESPTAVTYKSWNTNFNVGDATLIDDADRVLPFVPLGETPSVTRLKTAEIAPRQSITDTLVFTAPQGEYKALRLALPYAALAKNSKAFSGIRIAASELNASSTTDSPSGIPTVAAPGVIPPGVNAKVDPAMEANPSAAEKPISPAIGKEEPKKVEKPESIKDLVERDVEKLRGQDKQPGNAEQEMPSKSPPKKPPAK